MNRLVFLLILVNMAACQMQTPAVETATAVPTAVPTATLIPAPIPDTPAPMCTPPSCAAGEIYFCEGDCPGGCGTICATVTPAPATDLPPAPAGWLPLAAWLTDAWRGGFNPAAVRSALQTAGWQAQDADWHAADLDGDLRDEWILLLHAPEFAEKIAPANLWVVNNNGVIYQYHQQPNLLNSFSLKLQITGVADLTGDGRRELIINEESCGAHTCFGHYQVLAAANGRLENIVQLPPEQRLGDVDGIFISYPDARFSDHDQDGVTDFLVHGGSIGSVGAGIVRTYTEVWSWDGTAVTLAEVILDWTNYRHHIIYEANERMAAGDLAEALRLYEAAINDETLITPEFFHATEAETYRDISQFAAFRLILIDLLQGDAPRANGRLAWMQQNHAGAPLTTAAVTLVNQWSGAGNLPALCTAIEASLQKMDNPTGALSDLGYGNPVITAEDVCRPPAQP